MASQYRDRYRQENRSNNERHASEYRPRDAEGRFAQQRFADERSTNATFRDQGESFARDNQEVGRYPEREYPSDSYYQRSDEYRAYRGAPDRGRESERGMGAFGSSENDDLRKDDIRDRSSRDNFDRYSDLRYQNSRAQDSDYFGGSDMGGRSRYQRGGQYGNDEYDRSRFSETQERGGSYGRRFDQRQRNAGSDFGRDDRSLRDRDEKGRFVSDQNERGSYYQGAGGYGVQSQGGRSRYDRAQDGRSNRNDGRGWFGESERHAEAAERGWEDRDNEREQGGRGWHGDSRGHSQASRRGWQNRE